MLRVWIACLLFIICSSAGGYAQKITVDPNAAGAVKPAEVQEDFWSADTCLDQKVSYEARVLPVRTILADLSEKAGVKLNAGYTGMDWQVRDRRMFIFAKDIPLKDLMRSIARVMKFKWSRNTEKSPWSYRLIMDRKTLLGAEAQRYREEQKLTESISKARSKLISDFEASANMSEKDLAALKEKDPYTYSLIRSGVGPAFADLLRNDPKLAEAYSSGSAVTLHGSDLQPAAKEVFMRLALNANKLQTLASMLPKVLPDDISNDTDNLILELNRAVSQFTSNDPIAYIAMGEISISYIKQVEDNNTICCQTNLPLINPDSKCARYYAEAAIKILDDNQPSEKVRIDYDDPEAVQSVKEDAASKDWGEAPVEHAADPELEREIKLEFVPKTPGKSTFIRKAYEDYLSTLTRASGFAVVSDAYFNSQDSPSGLIKENDKIAEILNGISRDYVCNWWKQDQVLEFRDRSWFKKRAAQLPDEWLDRWSKIIKDTGILEIDDLAQICCLTKEQFQYNFYCDYQIGNVYSDSKPNKMLRFYSSLNKFQKSLLFSEQGLEIAALSPEQASKLMQVDPKLNSLDVVSVFGKREDKGYSNNSYNKSRQRDVYYRFDIFLKDKSVEPIAEFTLPAYQYPVKKEK